MGCLGTVEQRYLVNLIKNAAKNGYTRFVEPCAGTFAMSNLAIQNGYKPEQIGCAEIIGVAAYEQCEKFVETLDKYQQFTDIRNVGAAVHSMIDAANEKMDDAGFDPDMDWTYLAKVFGSAAIPVESAEVIKKALKKAEKDGTITSKNKWQMIEYWAADYLAGK